MDQFTSKLSPCALAVMAAGSAADNTAPRRTGDAGITSCENDPWYFLGFGLSSMFFSLASSGNCSSR